MMIPLFNSNLWFRFALSKLSFIGSTSGRKTDVFGERETHLRLSFAQYCLLSAYERGMEKMIGFCIDLE